MITCRLFQSILSMMEKTVHQSLLCPGHGVKFDNSKSFQVSSSLIVSGPLWIGPLHNAAYLTELLNLAEQWGWTSNDTETHLGKLLKQMIEESDPKLPFGYIKLDEVQLQKTSSHVLNSCFVCDYIGYKLGCNFIMIFCLTSLGSKPCKSKLSSPQDHDECPAEGILLAFSFSGFSIIISQETQ